MEMKNASLRHGCKLPSRLMVAAALTLVSILVGLKNASILNGDFMNRITNSIDFGVPPNSPTESSKICFVGQSSGIYVKDVDPKNVKESFRMRLDILRNVSLYSWDLAYANYTIKPYIRCPVKGWESNFDSYDDFTSYMGDYVSVQVDYEDNATNVKRMLMENNEGCHWIVITRLDADDAITPGYWKYVYDLIHSERFEPAGAGVVGTKLIPVVETTPDKCRANIEENKSMVKSQGISLVYRWDVFKRLNYPFAIGSHGEALGKLRADYNHVIQGKKVEDKKHKISNDEREELIKETGVHYVDSMVEGWGPPALWIRTSLSSHFPWVTWKSVPAGCDVEKWKSIINKEAKGRFSDEFLSHLYQHRNIGHLSMMDACKSNSYFLRFQYVRMQLPNKTQAKTCEEFVELYQSYL